MPHGAGKTCCVLGVVALGISAAWSALAADNAKKPAAASRPAKAAQAAPQSAQSKYFGVAACARCHIRPTPEDVDSGVTDFVLLTEYDTWSTKDKHSQAYERMVASERTKSMERLLKIDAKTEASCLACHAIHATASASEASFKVERGVSCEACHGASSQWVDRHWKPGWRTLSSDEKTGLGMFDVRDPVRRTQLCLSCHLGDVQQGKIVTHEMYAAGHPPLPGFELETFAKAMPAHWRHVWDKPLAIQKQLGYEPESMPQTKLVLGSSLVALRQAVSLLGDQAALEERPWPELALYDCQACHHDLRSPSWRQRRGFAGQPGRPSLHAWPLALAQLCISTTGSAEQRLSGLLKPLTVALDQQAFGSRAAVARAAAEVAGQLDKTIGQVASKPLTSADARALLSRICQQAAAAPVDYESARQLAWAWRMIYTELSERPKNDEQISAVVEGLAAQLALDLVGGRNTSDTVIDGKSPAVANRYDPAVFQAQMGKLRSLLEPSVPSGKKKSE